MTLTKEQAEDIKKQLLSQLTKLPKEQAVVLKKQIETASPDEIEAFINRAQKQQDGQVECIFCDIASGKTKTIKIYEDGEIIVIMDIMPASKGHLLVLPKKHYQFIQEIPDKLLNKLFYFVKKISPILVDVLEAKGISVYLPQGNIAGQRVPHFVINLIPRYEKDGLIFDWERKKEDDKNLEKIASKIRKLAETEIKKEVKEEVEKQMKKDKQTNDSEAQLLYNLSKEEFINP